MADNSTHAAEAELTQFIESVRRKYQLPSLAIAVSQEGQPDIIAASGMRKAGESSPVSKEDQFHFGSCGKAVTAAVIHKLAEKGQLQLDAPLSQIFPDNALHSGYQNVTIAELLTHTAGLPNIPGQPPSMETAALAQASTLESMKEQLAQAPAHERGTRNYSNMGYILLGHIAAQATGKPFEQLVREEIFEPLGMKSAGFGVPASPNAPWGHKDGEPVHDDGVPPVCAPSGGMHASVSDWTKFLKFEMKQPRLQNPYGKVAFKFQDAQGRDVEGEYIDSAFSKYKDGLYSHSGSNGFNMSRHGILPASKATYVIVTNEFSQNAVQAVDEVEAYVRERMIQPPVPEINIAVSDPQMLGKIKAEIITCCARKEFTAADISQIAEFRNDGITLRLNYLEGAMLFGGNQLLEKEIGLFPASASHTAAHLQELNAQNAARGVTITRVPSLDDEFRELVKQAEANIKGKENYKPKVPASVDDAFANNEVVAVGERHNEESGRLTIATKLPEIEAKNGALVIEHLFANRQKLMDDWLDAPAGTKMPPLLALTANAISGKDDQYYGTKRLIEDAKEAGVRVYGYETDATLMNNYNTIERGTPTVRMGSSAEYPRSAYDYRALVMNEAARKVITGARNHHGQIVVSAGTGHTLANEAQGVPGVTDHFGGAEFIAMDGKQPGCAITNKQPWPDGPQKTYPEFLLVTTDPEHLKQKLTLMQLARANSALPLAANIAPASETLSSEGFQSLTGQTPLWSEMRRNRSGYVSQGMVRNPLNNNTQ